MPLKSIFGKKSKPSGEDEKGASTTAPAAPAASEAAHHGADEPPTAAHLEAAILENASQDTPDTRSKVYQELLFSDLLLALADPDPAAEPPPEGEQSVNVAVLSNPQGIQFSAAFTSAKAARLWRAEGGRYVSMRGQDIFKLLEPSPADVVVINPGSAPFVALSKAEYRQLALGVLPQSQRSPVQIPAQQNGEGGEPGMQVSFPKDAFTDAQKKHLTGVLNHNNKIEAVVLGAISVPQQPVQNPPTWMRTVFIRTHDLEAKQDVVQQFCIAVRDTIRKNTDLFEQTPFEVGVMPDPHFWNAMHQNGFILFDKNPPKPVEA